MDPTERQHLESQIEDLQTKLTFQEDTIQTLNDMVAKQQQDIQQLQAQVDFLMRELQAVMVINQGNLKEKLVEERPPHY